MTADLGRSPAGLLRGLLWGGAAIVLVGGIWVVVELTGREQRPRRTEATIEEILLTGGKRQASLEGLAAQLDRARGENERLRGEVDRVRQDLARTVASIEGRFERELASDRGRSEAERQREQARLNREFGDLEDRMGDLGEADMGAGDGRDPALGGPDAPAPVGPSPDRTIMAPIAGAQGNPADPPPPRRADAGSPPERRAGTGPPPPPRRQGETDVVPAALPGSDLPPFPTPDQAPQPADRFLEGRNLPPGGTSPSGEGAGTGGRRRGAALARAETAPPVIRILGSDVPRHRPIPPVEAATYRLPATTILTGSLITGLDASTASQNRREPFPVLLRLQKTAILPNRYQADVRECFVLLAGYGDLSSERAYLRGETVACVLLDGEVIETGLKGYAAGEDGKAGVRGRLVTKQGQFIARALLTGFLQGAADVLDQSDNISFGFAQSQAEQDQGGNLWGSAALRGTGNALDRIAQFYIDQAYNLFPVIEIDAGRQVDIVLTGPLEMPLPNR
jgi:hypothetical protein